jgi:hypothetical protein
VKRFLLDSDTCIYLINRRPGYDVILDRVEGKSYGDIVVPALLLQS